MKILRDSPSKKSMYYLSTFTFLVAVLLLVFAVRPTLLTITSINKEIKEKEGIHKALEDKIDAMVELDEQYNEHKDTLDTLELIFPTSGNFSLFLSNIDAVVSRNGFVLHGINFSDYEKEDFEISTSAVSPWTVRLNVVGPENNLDNLFDDFEAMPMYPVIENFTYSDKEETETRMKSFSIGMRIYHLENNKFYSNENDSD